MESDSVLSQHRKEVLLSTSRDRIVLAFVDCRLDISWLVFSKADPTSSAVVSDYLSTLQFGQTPQLGLVNNYSVQIF
jgi:hypothetical protein